MSRNAPLLGYQNNRWILWKESWKNSLYSRDVVRFIEKEMYKNSIQMSAQSVNKTFSSEELQVSTLNENYCWLNYIEEESFIDEKEIKKNSEYEEAIRKELKALIENKT